MAERAARDPMYDRIPHLGRANSQAVEISRLKDALRRIEAVREFHVSAEVNTMRRIAHDALNKGAN